MTKNPKPTLYGYELTPQELERIKAEIELFDSNRARDARDAGIDRDPVAAPGRQDQAYADTPTTARKPAWRNTVIAMARKPTTPAKLREWRISLIGAGIKYVGRVEAADAESAIDKAMEEFRIEPARRFRLVAEPVE
jgi:hypothetical protein